MSKTLLLADDSVVIQKLVGLSFANEDVEIVTTDNGDDAVVMALDLKPDIVLADVVMPGKSGYEVCEAIKQNPALAHIPVLLLTGTFEAFDDARAAAAGADGQITKPFEAQALVERVKQVMAAGATAAAEPTVTASESSTDEYDFFDAGVSTLDSGDAPPQLEADSSSPDLTPAINTSDDPLFGAPGEGATRELNTESGGLALGESVSSADLSNLPEDDATIAILPEPPTPLPPSVGDPLAGFENDLASAEQANTPPPVPPTAVDLNPALDDSFEAGAVDPAATIVAGVEDIKPSPSLDEEIGDAQGIGYAFDDLTVHTPTSAIDQDVAAAPSPVMIGNIRPSEHSVDPTVVANLDISLAEPVADATPSAAPSLDLGPTNVSADELDFAFDVSEQVPASDLADPLGESFSSLMDISESQILAGPPSNPTPTIDPNPGETIIDDSFAAGYDVSSSDLATASPAAEAPMAAAFAQGGEDPILTGAQDDPDASSPASGGDPFVDRATPSLPLEEPDLELGTPRPTSNANERIPDLSPLVEQRIQETLEKVAWEAFSDLSESIVKQVIDRVEKIAWEVIPQMAETLVREEIRKMKGEKD